MSSELFPALNYGIMLKIKKLKGELAGGGKKCKYLFNV